MANIFRNPDYHMVDVQTAYNRAAPPPPHPPLYEFVTQLDTHFPTPPPRKEKSDKGTFFKLLDENLRPKRDMGATLDGLCQPMYYYLLILIYRPAVRSHL